MGRPAVALPTLINVPRIEPIVLPGAASDPRAPVRIFLGTEPAQHRAERVFCYSIERVRDRSRRYEIYRMSALPGFDMRAWRTGFTNYRFAVPALAGRVGCALYNDVDQIYTADPAGLFDLPMDGHGYLALSVHDTAVMLIDCARMAGVWDWAAACTQHKKALLTVAARSGLWGPLPPEWHARDTEYRAGLTRCLHYTALNQQPWQPTPQQYSYHPHPLGELWLALERDADAQGYEPYDARTPSPGFPDACTRLLAAPAAGPWPAPGGPALARRTGCRDLLTIGPATAPLWGGLANTMAGPAALREPGAGADLVAGIALETLPADDMPWVIGELFARARKAVLLRADLAAASAPADSPAFWQALVRRVARRFPAMCWRLELCAADGVGTVAEYDFPARGTPPRVWLLEGAHGGDNAQLAVLPNALGWPCEVRRLHFRPLLYRLPGWLLGASRLALSRADPPLTPPWPDLVLAAGRRSAPLARWLGRCGARTVLIGRPRAPVGAFDLILTTPQYGLPMRENVLHLPGPLCAAPPQAAPSLTAARARLEALPRPWIALLVGGPSRPYVMTADTARALGAAAAQAVAARGGTLLVCGSPRTPEAAFDGLCTTAAPAHAYRFRPADDNNPYRDWLALADGFVVTGESASLLAEAVATGKPVAVYPLPVCERPWTRAASWLGARLGFTTRAAGSRGTERQQDLRGRLYDALVAAGVITPPRALEAVHAALGVRPLPEGLDAPPWPGAHALAGAHAHAMERTRELFITHPLA